MIFACDSCGAQYKIEDTKVGNRGVRVKCKRCGHMIVVRPQANGADDSTAVTDPPKPPSADKVIARAPGAAAGAEEDKTTITKGLSPSAGSPPPRQAFRPEDDDPDAAALSRLSTRVMNIDDMRERAKEQQYGQTAVDVLAKARERERKSPGKSQASSSQWYIAIRDNEKQVGPISFADLKSYWSRGEINAGSLAWRAGLSDWAPIEEIEELSELLSLPGPEAAPPALSKSIPPPVASIPGNGAPAEEEVSWSPGAGAALLSLAEEELQALNSPKFSSPAIKVDSLPFDRPSDKAAESPRYEEEDEAPAPREPASEKTVMLPAPQRPAAPLQAPVAPPPAFRAPAPGEPQIPKTAIYSPAAHGAPQKRSNDKIKYLSLATIAVVVVCITVIVVVVVLNKSAPQPAPQQGPPVVQAPAPMAAAPAPAPVVEKKPEPPPPPKEEPKDAAKPEAVVQAPGPKEEPKPAVREEKREEPRAAKPREAPRVVREPKEEKKPAAAASKSSDLDLDDVLASAPKKEEPKPREEPKPKGKAAPSRGGSLLDDIDSDSKGGGADDILSAIRSDKDTVKKGLEEAKEAKKATPPPPAVIETPKRNLTKEQIMSTVKGALPRIRNCTTQQLQLNPNLRGRLLMSWLVKPDGSTAGIRSESPQFRGQFVETCMTQVVGGLKFPQHDMGDVPVNRFPFDF
ncbi:MAG: hypothetical protein GMKNLPBB_01394 [Myxococcota bacterium]|nr:hypothetical protein [Myxococcota bacterium]